MAYCVYCHTFPNGKKYIGITKQEPSRRWRNGKGYEGQPVFNAILKYGWDNIRHEILFENLTRAEAEAKEIELIEALETNSHKHGYNVENGGCAPDLSDETKAKLSNTKKNYYKTHEHWNKGNHWSDETRAKISNSHKGKKMSEEQKEKHRARDVFVLKLKHHMSALLRQADKQEFAQEQSAMFATRIPDIRQLVAIIGNMRR